MIKKNNKGITLLEAFLAAFIFIISVSAIFVTMTNLRKPAVNNEQAVAAALTLSNILEDLRSKVDSRDYDTGKLSIRPEDNPHKISLGTQYKIAYNVTADPSGSGARKVDASIFWNDTL